MRTTSNIAIFVALERAVKPFVRLMLARGITYTQFTEWMKGIFLDTALQEIDSDGKELSDSRLSVATGLHRKDIKRLRELPNTSKQHMPENINAGSHIVSKWLSDPRFMDGNLPRAIPRLKKDGGDVSFESLAESVTKDVRARAFLDELIRLGVVKIDTEDKVTLLTEAFIPATGIDEKAYYLGLGVGDHAEAAVHNVLGGQPPFMDRVVHYDSMSLDSIYNIQELAYTKGNLLLQEINKTAEQLPTLELNPNTKPHRFTFGIFFYSTDQEKP